MEKQRSSRQSTRMRMKRLGRVCAILLLWCCATISAAAAAAFGLRARPETSEVSRFLFFRDLLGLASIGSVGTLPLPSFAMYTDPKTGILLPSVGEIEGAISTDWDGVESPFEGAPSSQFARLDSSNDSIFYKDPRFVEHVDENAVRIMTDYISNQVSSQDSVLDLCSSWTSHIDASKLHPKMVVGLGMNEKELASNPSLTSYNVQDLNTDPKLPYERNSFSVVLCQLSIDYLAKPLDVLKEVGRVLQPGGTVHILFSNRLFLSKAVGLWTGADDIDHAYTVGCYLHFCNGGFESITARDLSSRQGRNKQIVGDPLYVVTAKKMLSS